MKYTYTEAQKEMDVFVEKMKLTFPEEAYKIQCAWESMLEGCVSEKSLEDAYEEGYEDGKEERYCRGYEDGYNDGYSDGVNTV